MMAGTGGIEGVYNSVLTGHDGYDEVEFDARRRMTISGDGRGKAAENGGHVQLSLVTHSN